MKNLGIIGRGNTGKWVADLAHSCSESQVVFHSQNPVSVESLRGIEVAVAFTQMDLFKDMITDLIHAKVQVASGCTGEELPIDLDDRLKDAGLAWIQASNFSLGMQFIRHTLESYQRFEKVLDGAQLSIHEVHHTRKKDSPSGTALQWGKWIGREVSMSSERTGDVIGDHSFSIETDFETLRVEHFAKSRALFAKGALWAADLLDSGKLAPGLHHFDDVMDMYLGGKL